MHTATDTLDRITARTEIDTTTGCLVWTGDVDRDGYGRISLRGRMRKVHRVAYGILRVALLPGVVLRQECGNRRCWQPVAHAAHHQQGGHLGGRGSHGAARTSRALPTGA